MDRPEEDIIVQKAREEIQDSSLVTTLFDHQRSDGGWGESSDQWSEKGTVFSLLILGELGTEASNKTERALDHLRTRYQEPSERICNSPIDTRRSRNIQSSTWGWCITAVALRAALLLGHIDHPLVQEAISFFERNYEERGGWPCSAYSGDPHRVRPPNCYMGTIKALAALSLIPVERRSRRIRELIEQEVKTCLDNRVFLYRVDRNGDAAPKRAWLRFAFPRYWRSDVLEATDVLTSLGVCDQRLAEALTVIRKKRGSDGVWHLDFSETRRTWVTIDEVGAPSKWITLRAMRVLHRTESMSLTPVVECTREQPCTTK